MAADSDRSRRGWQSARADVHAKDRPACECRDRCGYVRGCDRVEHRLEFGVSAEPPSLDEIADELAGYFIIRLGAAEITSEQVLAGSVHLGSGRGLARKACQLPAKLC